jgi:hypothetical protein
MISLWQHVYGEQQGILGLFSGIRRRPGSKKLEGTRTAYFEWSSESDQARAWAEREAMSGRETYHCTHLLTARRRIKANAAPVSALWVDGDGAKVCPGVPSATAVIESSPGREQFYWRLTALISPRDAERFNRRLALAIGADKSGWDLTQLLRPPDTPNFKYMGTPRVRILEIKDERYDPLELDRLLPPLPREEPMRAARSCCPKDLWPTPDLSRLSPRMRELIRYGNHSKYPSRSEADMAACLAMFGAGYAEGEVWAVLTDPTNGISEKYFEKGRDGERYLALTIGKARAHAQGSSRLRRGRAYAWRKGVITLG